MPIENVPELIDALERCGLLTAPQVATLRRNSPTFRDYKELAKTIVLGYKWLTRYQIVHVIRGDADTLFFGGYLLLELVGQGGMGQVFKARHLATGRVVALKVVRPEKLASALAVRRFRREVKALAKLRHPNVVLAFDANEWQGSHFIVMEFVEGIDLARWVKEAGRLPVAQAADCVRQAALGLQHAHDLGFIHRDVKPSNLLYATATKATKLLDLGLVWREKADGNTSVSELTQEGAIVGTVDFISPEQATDSRSVDRRSDLYSLGCTFYYLLTGQPPFTDKETLEKLLKHKLEEPTPIEFLRDDVPPELVMIVRRLMAKSPKDRYQSAGELAQVLDGWLRATLSGELKAFTPPLAAEASDFSVSPSASTLSGTADFANLMDEVTDERLMPAPERPPPAIRKTAVFLALVGSLALIAAAVAAMAILFPKVPRPSRSTDVIHYRDLADSLARSYNDHELLPEKPNPDWGRAHAHRRATSAP